LSTHGSRVRTTSSPISFGPSEDEGRRTEEAYRDALRPIVRVPLDDLLDRRGAARRNSDREAVTPS